MSDVDPRTLRSDGRRLDQLRRLVAAAQQKGPGVLVHHTLGRRQVVCVGFGSSSRWDAGRKVEVKFSFIESGTRTAPAGNTNTKRATKDAADKLDDASKGSFSDSVKDSIAKGGAVKGQIGEASGGWVSDVVAFAKDAGSVVRSVSSIASGVISTVRGVVSTVTSVVRQVNNVVGAINNFGRFFRGWRSVSSGLGGVTSTLSQVNSAVSSALRIANTARSAVRSAANLVTTIGSFL